MKPDAIIVGGGIQGVTLALAMAERGLHPVIVERNGLGAGASGNSYGIVHGGLRYLQTLDLPRWRRSRLAQSWFLDEFPAYVKPLRCVMPLYQGRLRSPPLFRAAMLLQQWLASAMRAHVPLPPPRLLTAAQVRDEFDVPGQRLLGAACWHDAEVRDMPGLLEAMLKRSGGDKGTLLIPGEARDLLEDEHGVAGLRIARPDGKTEDMSCRVVINCAGAWLGRWQQKAACPTSNTLAFNLLLSGRLPGNSALAVSATPGKGRSYFVRPHPEGIFAGTYYRPAIDAAEPEVTEQDVDDFLSELDLALPGWNLRNAQVKRITAGLLPDKDGNGRKLSSGDHILVHRPRGFYSILGGKFTTAPLLSRDAIRMIWPGDMPEAAASTLAKTHV
jgi:glycerol-3-phosphate dehydrogenase